MAGKKGSTDNKAIKVLTGLSGVGAATAAKMVAAGMKTPAGVRKAGISGLVKAGISASSAKKIVAGLPKAAAKKAKSTAKKTTAKAKTAAKQAKSTAKKTTAKAKTAAKKTTAKAKQTVAAAKKKAPAKEKLLGKTIKTPSLKDMLKRVRK